jgi:hypothetical protein
LNHSDFAAAFPKLITMCDSNINQIKLFLSVESLARSRNGEIPELLAKICYAMRQPLV